MCNTSKGTTMSVTESLAISSVEAPSRIRCPSTIQLELGCSGSPSGHKQVIMFFYVIYVIMFFYVFFIMSKCSHCVIIIFRYFRYRYVQKGHLFP